MPMLVTHSQACGASVGLVLPGVTPVRSGRCLELDRQKHNIFSQNRVRAVGGGRRKSKDGTADLPLPMLLVTASLARRALPGRTWCSCLRHIRPVKRTTGASGA